MSDRQNQILADQQAKLVASLTAGRSAPAGFDSSRIRLAAAMLRTKKQRAVQRAWPGLAKLLGTRFGPEFEAFSQISPKDQADARALATAFAHFAIRSPRLPLALRFRIAAAVFRRWMNLRISSVARRIFRSRREGHGVQSGSQDRVQNQE